MKQPDINRIAQHYSAILTEIGADLASEGMRETPLRAAKALVEMTEGSRMDTDQLTTMFRAECQKAVCHDMVIVEGIREVGQCEHHLLPIIMSITIAYVPDQKILGLSKVARIAGYFARRWQNQERTAHLIAEFIEKTVEALGVAVLIDGKHMCAMARGVRDNPFDHEGGCDARGVSNGPERAQRAVHESGRGAHHAAVSRVHGGWRAPWAAG